MRGIGSSGASRALILLDGVPITDPFGGWVNWSQVPREAVEEAEMVRGGASDLYGGQALSGVVQLLTKTPEATDADLDLSYGNESTPNASGYVGHAFGNWLASAAGEYFRTAGYTPVEPQQRGFVDNAANSLHRTGELQLQRQLSGRSRAFVRGLGYDDSRHNGTVIEVNRTRAWQAATGFDWEGSAGDLFQARGYGGTEDYHQTFASVAANRNSETLARVQQVPSRSWGASAQYSRNLTTRDMLLAGVDFSHVVGESDDEIFIAGKPSSLVNAGGTNRSTGVFAEDILHLTARWIVTGVFRFDDWQTITGSNRTTALPSQQATLTTFPDRSETSFDPKLGTKYQLSNVVSLRASAYRSFRSPTLNELYRSFRLGNVQTNANQQLRAERLTGVEAGPGETLLHGRINLQQGFFWAEVNRPIANVTLSTTPSLITRMRENLGSTRAAGLEAEAEVQLFKFTGFSAQYQFVDAIVTAFSANPSLIGLQVPEVPRHEFTFQAHYSNPRVLTVALQGRSASSAFDDDVNTLPLGSYSKLDAFISRRINSYVDAYVAGENLLNQHFIVARTPTVTLGSPIVGRVGVQVHLRR
jgi:outer membrane receptor protein involved in Fe transport